MKAGHAEGFKSGRGLKHKRRKKKCGMRREVVSRRPAVKKEESAASCTQKCTQRQPPSKDAPAESLQSSSPPKP